MRKLNDTELDFIGSMASLLTRYDCKVKGVDKKIRIVSGDGLIDIDIDEVIVILALKK